MIFFSRRAQRSMYTQAEGQPGAAGWLLENQLRGDWRLKQAVAGTTHLDVVHRLVGRPGVVLVGEGAQHRVRGLIAQEKKKVARLAGDTPIYDMVVGTEDGDIALGKLQKHLLKLPHNLSKEQVAALDKRLGRTDQHPRSAPPGPDAGRRQDAQCAAHRPPAHLSGRGRPTCRARESRRGADLPRPAPRPAGRRTGLIGADRGPPRRVRRRLPGLGPGRRAVRPRHLAPPLALPGSWSLIPFAIDYVVGLLVAGRTLGMNLFGLRLVRVDQDAPVGPGRAVVRTALLMLFIPALVFDRDNRGLHDRVTDTAVVRA